MRLAFLILVVALIAMFATAKTTRGTKNGKEQDGFVFLDNFAYDVNPTDVSGGAERVPVGWSDVQITLKDKADFGKSFSIWSYTDAERDWPRIYPKKMLCPEKIIQSHGNTNELVKIDPTTGIGKVKIAELGGTRRRFHYLALVHCGGFGEFDFTLHSYRDSGKWSRELGVNDSGSNTFYILWFIVYVGILAATMWNYKRFLDKQEFVHSILKLFTFSVLMAFFNILSELIHWGAYTTNGAGHPWVLAIGDVCEIIGSTSFLLLLLLLSQGWAISSGLNNSNLKRKKIIIGFVSLFGLLKVVAFLLKTFAGNPAQTGTSNSYVVFYSFVLVFELVFGAFYVISLLSMIKVETNPVKNRFMKFLMLFTFYILAVATVAVISFALDPWVRDFLVNLTAVLAVTVAQCVMLFLLWFSRSAQYFELSSPTELVHDDLNYENF